MTTVLRVHSAVLGEEVLLAPDGADIDLWRLQHPKAPAFSVVYFDRELTALLGLSPDALRLIHEVKREFSPAVLRLEPMPTNPNPTRQNVRK